MAELILEPYSARLHWQRADSGAEVDWHGLAANMLESVARRCEVEGETVIGHIKGLATFAQGGFLRANIVSAEQPADVAGTVPPDCCRVVFTVNVLVYGLSYKSVSERFVRTAGEVSSRWGVDVTVEPFSAQHESHHHH